MKAVFQRYYFTLASGFFKIVFSRRLYGALVCLGTGIGEENLFHAGFFAQQLSQFYARLAVVEVGRMLQCCRLPCYCGDPFVVGSTERIDRDTAAEIDVFSAVFINQCIVFHLGQTFKDRTFSINKHRPFAAFKNDRKALVCTGYIFFVLLDYVHTLPHKHCSYSFIGQSFHKYGVRHSAVDYKDL